MWGPKEAKAQILGRAWVYDEDPPVIECWEHEFEPMELNRRSGADWCREFLADCTDLRDLFKLPKVGSFQVLFKGVMEGAMSGYFEPEWDEWFTVEDVKYEPVPKQYLAMVTDKTTLQVSSTDRQADG